ncbi:sensor domain-containing diguanylate cyclase [Metabacillus fastidiosus]|uniref:Sensor domain-containing diguanylate cyclase n=1 Tax=Metabacillus fastidiosus TaxID=1458 RepID=A0ABU6P1Z5_9BACI|nr:sensor domain-containing diguanylate cyclase [Metabacillus fastidiosus]MED4403384.1 sensor domain-containing diguanylate cyclase [Metabacillus fastidiosus]MED4453980.1 sensor domain-containing diguanylate cyclase [Metabacillus fastidiosus]MED4460738.1 sensor domain-containing diguanylate cyclase [Metabacillus fastidiosus]
MDERLKYAPCGYVSVTNQGVITYMNQTFLDMVEYNQNDLLHQHIESIMTVANKFLFHTYFYPFIQLYGYVNEVYLTLKSSKDEDIPVLLNGRRCERDGIELVDCVFVHMRKRIDYEQEIRKSKKEIEKAYEDKNEALVKLESLHEELEMKQRELIVLNEELERLATTDGLTGLKNRRYFLEELNKNITLFSSSQSPFSLLIIDVDHFKKINDTFGHLTGDEILRGLAKIMTSISREIDIVARYGGEEFIILLPHMDKAAVKQQAEKLRSAIEKTKCADCFATVSIGAATFTDEDTDISILAKADTALYESKNEGRNRVTHADELVENR